MADPEVPEIYWDNKIEVASLTALSVASGFNINSLADADRGTIWRAGSLTPQEIQADFPVTSIQAADAMILDNHNLVGLELSLVRASSLDFFDADTIAVFTPNSLAPILQRFTSVTFASIKVNIPTISAGTFAAIGEWFVGPRFTFGRNPSAPFDPDERITRNISRTAESGRTVRLHRFQRRMANLRFRNVDEAFYSDIRSWWDNRAAIGKPFWWSFRPVTTPEKTFFAAIQRDNLRFPLSPHIRNGTLMLQEEL